MTVEELLGHFGTHLGSGSPVALAIALLAGMMASAVCPCTVPVGVGMAAMAGTSEATSRRNGFLVATSFFAGMVVNLAVLGTVSGRLGGILSESFGRYWALAMTVVSLAAASVAFKGPRLKTGQLSATRKPGLAGAFGYGFVFSLGTSAAPLLLVLTVAAANGSPARGFLLALAFGIGRGFPFLVAGLFAGVVTRLVQRESWRRAIQILSGCALLFVSAYYARTFASLL